MKRIVIACGGTGGHLAPGIALAEAFAERGGRAVLFISRKQVDSRLIEKYEHLHFRALDAAPLTWRPVGLCRFFFQQARGLCQAVRFMVRERPERVVAFGGFTSLGAVLAARCLRIPVVLHEANHRPGRAIRLLAGLARRVYLPEGVAMRNIRRSRMRYCGYPVRAEIRRMPRDTARRRLGLSTRGKLLAVLGGSQGAQALNDWVRDHFDQLAADGISMYCVTGLGKSGAGKLEKRLGEGDAARLHFVPFTDEMAQLLSAADVVITRAGAGALAEIQRCRTPAILVPYPHAADNHQWHNAQYLEQHGGAVVVPQHRLGELVTEVRDLIFNDWLLARLRSNLEKLDREDSATLILDDLEHLDNRANASARSPRFLTA